MPIHDFKKIEEVEKEVKDGKAQIIEPKIKTIQKEIPKKTNKIEIIVPDIKGPKIKEPIKQKSKKVDHPMICGSLEIEEEEL